MTIKEAIKKAIEGGYNQEVQNWETTPNKQLWMKLFLLDPAFWQCLGKAMRWASDLDLGRHGKKPSLIGYLMYWHQLIDHLAAGKDINSFFEKLK